MIEGDVGQGGGGRRKERVGFTNRGDPAVFLRILAFHLLAGVAEDKTFSARGCWHSAYGEGEQKQARRRKLQNCAAHGALKGRSQTVHSRTHRFYPSPPTFSPTFSLSPPTHPPPLLLSRRGARQSLPQKRGAPFLHRYNCEAPCGWPRGNAWGYSQIRLWVKRVL